MVEVYKYIHVYTTGQMLKPKQTASNCIHPAFDIPRRGFFFFTDLKSLAHFLILCKHVRELQGLLTGLKRDKKESKSVNQV